MYTRGNPLKYTDPSGHCAVLEDGSRDSADQECWDSADAIYAMWGVDGSIWGRIFQGVDRDYFMQHIATQRATDLNWMRMQHQTWYGHFAQEHGLQIQVTWDEPPPHPIEGIADAIMPDCENTDCTGRFLNGVSTASSFVAAGCTAAVVTGPCAPAATFVGVVAGGFATLRAGEKARQPEATSVDVIDAVMSGATTVAGGLSHPYLGPLISVGQWTYDEYISPAMR
jgi:hypothetical protein